MAANQLDPFDLGVLDDPFPLYAQLRSEPSLRHVEHMDLFLVARHADVKDAASRKDDFSSHLAALVMADAADADGAGASLVDVGGGAPDVLATADPPHHPRQRKVVAQTFREVAAATGAIGESIRTRVAPLLGAGPCELMGALALPVPVQVIADVLGLPADDHELLRDAADAGVELLSGVTPPDRMAECITSVAGLMSYLDELIAWAGAHRSERLLGTFAGAIDDGTVTAAEATAMAMQLVIAGSDSTGNLIGNAVRIMAEQPAVQAQLRADPDLVPDYLEEVLRHESPFRGHFRVATTETTLGGTPVHAGARLFLLWGSANRDPEVFHDPDEVVIGRPNAREHLGFGWGIHRCVGAPLARLEARLALEALLASTSSITPAAGAPRPAYVPSMLVRRLAHLHVELDA